MKPTHTEVWKEMVLTPLSGEKQVRIPKLTQPVSERERLRVKREESEAVIVKRSPKCKTCHDQKEIAVQVQWTPPWQDEPTPATVFRPCPDCARGEVIELSGIDRKLLEEAGKKDE